MGVFDQIAWASVSNDIQHLESPGMRLRIHRDDE
jgi:hypothetical protein